LIPVVVLTASRNVSVLWALNKLSTQKHYVSLKKAPIGAFFVSALHSKLYQYSARRVECS